jgi:hypothetical protein
MITASAEPLSSPVAVNVPSLSEIRASLVLEAKVSRIPSEGSTARRELIESFHSGWASKVLVNRPVPDATLYQIKNRYHRAITTHSTMLNGPFSGSLDRIKLNAGDG